MDCLDAYILGATVKVMELECLDGMPIKWRLPPLLKTAEKSDQYQWLTKLAQEILEKHVKLDKGKKKSLFARDLKNQLHINCKLFILLHVLRSLEIYYVHRQELGQN